MISDLPALAKDAAHSISLALGPRALQTHVGQLLTHQLLAALVAGQIPLQGFLMHLLNEADHFSVLGDRCDRLWRYFFVLVNQVVVVAGIGVAFALAAEQVYWRQGLLSASKGR